MLAQHGVCRRIKPVNIDPMLRVLPNVVFFRSGQTGVYPVDVAMNGRLPKEVHTFVEDLGLGGSTARIVLRKLAPGQGIPAHVDDWMPQEADWHRFQIPLITHPAIRMRWPDDGVEQHLEAGWLWEVRFDRLHEVVNEADCERIHLQVDQIDATI